MALTVLDAGVVIAVLNANDMHNEAAQLALRDARQAGDTLVLPASAYAEVLVEPFEHDEDAAIKVDQFLAALPCQIHAVDRQTARIAAQLRARHSGLKLPDAMVIASADALKASRVLTTDRRWPGGVAVTLEVVSGDPERRGRDNRETARVSGAGRRRSRGPRSGRG